MKYIKSVDFTGQSVIFIFLLVSGLATLLATGELGAVAYYGLICQFVLGCWQMVSAILCLILKADHFKLRIKHLVLSIICLGLIALLVSIKNSYDHSLIEALLIAVGIVLPWSLGVFYYTITWRWMFPKKTSKFLPHINF